MATPIPGIVKLTGIVAPAFFEDTYAVIDPQFGIDGLRNVADNTERNAIFEGRRRQGMIVGTQSDGTYWTLKAAPWAYDDTDWNEFESGGGVSDHNLLNGIQGGSTGGYYHSDQPINITDDIEFATITSTSVIKIGEWDTSIIIEDGLIQFDGTNFSGYIGTEWITLNNLWEEGIGANSVKLRNSGNTANGSFSVATGISTTASGFASVASGVGTTSSGYYSSASGLGSIASGQGAHAEGLVTIAGGDYSHTEGQGCITVSGVYGNIAGHAEGLNTISLATAAHAEGSETTAAGLYSHAEGYKTITLAPFAHSEGEYSTASGISSHSQGKYTIASGTGSHSGGYGHNGVNGKIIAAGEGSFNHSYINLDHLSAIGVQANFSAILGGVNNNIIEIAERSVILGGINQTGDEPDTVYVPKLVLTDVTADSIDAGAIRWNGVNFQGYKGTGDGWVNLDESGNSNTEVTLSSTDAADSFSSILGDSSVWQYNVKNGSNLRAGTVVAVWDNATNSIEFTEMSTSDLGDASPITFEVEYNSAGDIELIANITSGTWTIKTNRKII